MRYISLLLVVLSVGCMKVGPNFEPPAPAQHGSWIDSSAPQLGGGGTDFQEWWELFNDPTLNDLIARARQDNLSLQAAGQRILQARALLGIAFGRQFPQLQQVEASATRQQLSRHTPNTAPGIDLFYDEYNVGMHAIWELDFWGKYRRAVESAEAGLAATEADYDDVMVLLLADVASRYVSLRTLQAKEVIIRENISLQTRSVEITQARYEAGVVTELDVAQATGLLKETEARLPEIQAQLRQQTNALAVLLGTTPSEMEFLTNSPGAIPSPTAVVATGMPAEMLARRADLRRALNEAAAQCAQIGVAISQLFPSISFTGFIGFKSSGNIMTTFAGGGGKLLSGDSLTYLAGPGLQWPILNYGRLWNDVKFNRARFEELVLVYKDTVLNAYREVEDGLISYLKALERKGFLDSGVIAARRALKLANDQYIEGTDDFTRVLQTQQTLLTQQEAQADATGAIAASLVSTYRALGGGWSTDE